ncbi:hypothetical protein N7495_001048 [Penicillium taxi]|uniref:uncharacterized protein n=1 Tax=Penicillium taxi TaxID=168475 RepID=UPI002544E054|nr:uncharacterized protein N7495_001048 [Penicillium taxi]KAJ5908366.1 hypothetical protein N7495_001048 [Penicillium taxi]
MSERSSDFKFVSFMVKSCMMELYEEATRRSCVRLEPIQGSTEWVHLGSALGLRFGPSQVPTWVLYLSQFRDPDAARTRSLHHTASHLNSQVGFAYYRIVPVWVFPFLRHLI